MPSKACMWCHCIAGDDIAINFKFQNTTVTLTNDLHEGLELEMNSKLPWCLESDAHHRIEWMVIVSKQVFYHFLAISKDSMMQKP